MPQTLKTPSAITDGTYTMEQYCLLDAEQEQQLARRWRELGDQAALHALVKSHLRLAAKVARHYRGYGLPLPDIIAEANVGLVVAAQRFEPDRGSRFSTYALWWIKANIHEYILRSWSLVKIGTTAAQKKLFFRLRSEIRKVSNNRTSLTPEIANVVAEHLGVTAADVIEMDGRLRGDFSLNKPMDDDGQAAEWETMLVDDSPDAEVMLAERDETSHQTSALLAALKVLTPRERQVFEARRLTENPPTLAELARRMDISPERVRQIENHAFEKVKRAAVGYLKTDRLTSDGPTSVPPTHRDQPYRRNEAAYESMRADYEMQV
ncbi:RNA polymerase factor sigma-32 [Bradyrhizobium cenepequi]|uniref:RNA polymerase factor sigma-32 n=1 Tax=Bradyrhizobium cenepequi TaxID=2821403 RepID=UPI001CE2AA9A|nr:RNA polymerase factor sigma-32 [Bradyrhizobium cenepequi]